MKNHPASMLKSIGMFLMICCICLAGCENVSASEPVTASVTEEDNYGDLRLDLKEINLEYGDSVNISFSGGCEIREVPFYPDFYGRINTAILTDYFDTLSIAGIGHNFNRAAGIKIGEEVKISLEQKGRYKNECEAYNVPNAKIQARGQSDEAFRNAREVTAGSIQEKRLYRGASPFDPKFGRVQLMDQYMRDNHIQCVLDLADTKEKLQGYEDIPDYTAFIIANDQVIPCAMGVDHLEPAAMQTLGRGLAAMTEKKGPYLIHCNLGRDRTGVICAILEALCGATYQEIVEDYMLSYDMLHGIDMDPASLQYKLFRQRIDDQLNLIFDTAIEQLPQTDLQTPAHDYLIRCGMTEKQVQRLKDRLVR